MRSQSVSISLRRPIRSAPFFFFFNDTATTEIYTLSLHDALPISLCRIEAINVPEQRLLEAVGQQFVLDRKSTRLNSSHGYISYAVFCLKKKKLSAVHTRDVRALINDSIRDDPSSRVSCTMRIAPH